MNWHTKSCTRFRIARCSSRVTFRVFLMYVLIAIHGQHEACAEDWPSFRGNRQLTGVSTSALPENLELLWTFEAGDGIESTAAIYKGVAYFGARDGYLYAVILDTGKLKWKYQALDEIKSSPAVSKDSVYFGDGAGVFHSVDVRTGEARWIFQTDAEIVSSANVAVNRVLFGSYDQWIYCLDTTNGSLIWKLETEGYVHSTPSITNETAVIMGCDSYMRLVSLEDGDEKRKIKLGSYVAASAAVLKNTAYAGTFASQVVAVDLQNARMLWRYEHAHYQFPFYASAAVSETVVIVGGRDKMIHALNPRTGESVWTFAAQARVDSSPVIVHGRVYFATTAGVIYSLNIGSGEKVWEFVTGSAIIASPSVSAGKLLIGSDNGNFYCFGD